ncbi:MAG TPA: sulfite exporter TauE/SafE family protein [Vicinamibacterales bacterium]|nr:sulfite exporter TauE/SafE family protein [Vicinamibacterales bacterium]
MDFTLPATGFFVGILIGLTGIGGGAIMTPFLILVLGTRPVVAVGTDLVYGAVTKIVGAYFHWRQGTVNLQLVRRLAVASVPGGLLAVALLRTMPRSGLDADAAVRRVLGVVLIMVAVLMVLRLRRNTVIAIPERWRTRLQGPGTYAIGGLVGALVGFTSVGSGSLLVPFLVSVYPLTTPQIVGTDVFHAAILVTVTAVAHAQGQSVDWLLASSLLLGSVPGVTVGSWMAPRVSSLWLRAALAALLLLTGVNLI